MRMKILMAACMALGLNIAFAEEPDSKRLAADPQQQTGLVDAVVAVVNDDVITRYELDERVRMVSGQLRKQNIPLPEEAVLEKQILDRMVIDMLQVQYAAESGIRVDDAQLNQAIMRIAQQNGFPSLAEFQAKLNEDGIEYPQFRNEIRKEIVFTRLREREVESKITVSDSEVDNYLSNQARSGSAGEEFLLAHILITVPEQASADSIQAARARAVEALSQIRSGADFAQVAAGYSDAPDALKGGDLGWRAVDRIPPLFMNELQTLQPGQATEVLRSPNGFHILKLIEKRSGDAPVMVTQTHARHILIKTSEIVPDSEARQRLFEIKARIEAGADFAEQARRYSQDGSAQQGGDLDWLSPGQTVPEFEEEMNKLKPGEIGATRSQFGWHLIQVLERRDTNFGEQQKRQQARAAIGSFKSDEQYQDWLRQLRDRAFVEYRSTER